MKPGDTIHYQPDLDLPGIPVRLLRYEPATKRVTRRALIEWWEIGVLELPNGIIRHGYRFRRRRWVPLRHLAALTPALHHRVTTTQEPRTA